MDKDPFQLFYKIEISDYEVVIEKRPKRSYLTISLAFLLVPLLFTLFIASVKIFFIANNYWELIGCIFFLGLTVLMIKITWDTNSNGPYPIVEISFLDKSVFRKSQFPFYDDKLDTFSVLTDISFRTKAVGGSTSTYEEGNTDYRKSLVLETDQGDIPVLTYYARNENLEHSAQIFADLLKQKLTNTSE